MVSSRQQIVAPRLVIKHVPKGTYRPGRPEKTPARVALACALGIQGAIFAALALIHIEDWSGMFNNSGNFTIVHIEDTPVDDRDEPPAEPEQAAMPVFPETPEIIVSAETESSWSWPVATPDNVEPYPDIDEAPPVLALMEMGTTLPERSRPARTAARSAPEASSAPGPAGRKPSQSARYKHTPLPPYPKSARQAGHEGVVMLWIDIDEKGFPKRVRIAESSGVQILDEVAVSWVRSNWSFYPALDNDIPVSSQTRAPLRFRLR